MIPFAEGVRHCKFADFFCHCRRLLNLALPPITSRRPILRRPATFAGEAVVVDYLFAGEGKVSRAVNCSIGCWPLALKGRGRPRQFFVFVA